MVNEFYSGIITGLWIGISIHYYIKFAPNKSESDKKSPRDKYLIDLSEIREIISLCKDVRVYINSNNFVNKQNKEFDELLTRGLLKMDNITTADLKPLRKGVINTIHGLHDQLDKFKNK
tara:strand:- start:439 stop:795 length:357 start_codon:yes stop_codon:yes gene_type:complete